MSQKPPTRAMRENPDIDQLKRQAKELLEAYRKQQPEAVAEVNFHHRTAAPETFALHDEQFVNFSRVVRNSAAAKGEPCKSPSCGGISHSPNCCWNLKPIRAAANGQT